MLLIDFSMREPCSILLETKWWSSSDRQGLDQSIDAGRKSLSFRGGLFRAFRHVVCAK